VTVLDARPAPDAALDAPTPPAWEPRVVTRARGLADLLRRRPELVGVYDPADVTAEALRWTA